MLGKIKVENLIEDVHYHYDGDTVKVSGNLKTISEPWTEFQKSGDNTGHFIPLKVPATLANKDVTFVGKAAETTLHIDDDRLLVVRLENLTGLTCEIKLDGETIVKYDFTALVPVGEKARDADKVDFGGFGKMETYTEGLELVWHGNTATAHGTLKYYDGTAYKDKVKDAGNYFPLALTEWFEGVPHKAYIKNAKVITQKDIIIKVESLEKPIKVEYNGMTVMQIDISGMTMAGS